MISKKTLYCIVLLLCGCAQSPHVMIVGPQNVSNSKSKPFSAKSRCIRVDINSVVAKKVEHGRNLNYPYDKRELKYKSEAIFRDVLHKIIMHRVENTGCKELNYYSLKDEGVKFYVTRIKGSAAASLENKIEVSIFDEKGMNIFQEKFSNSAKSERYFAFLESTYNAKELKIFSNLLYAAIEKNINISLDKFKNKK